MRTGASVTCLDDCTADSLQRLCEELTAQRFRAAITVEMLWGEADVRLQVRRPEPLDLVVELMAPDPPAWTSPNWDGVRVEHGHRQVWRGPDRTCSLNEVRRFVQALLCLDQAQLAAQYVDLG
jgi:hypothetical protein